MYSFGQERMSTYKSKRSKPQGDGAPAETSPGLSSPSKQTNQATIGLLSRTQVARRLGVCPHTVQRLTRRGLLQAYTFNRRLIRYSPEVVDAYIRAATMQYSHALNPTPAEVRTGDAGVN